MNAIAIIVWLIKNKRNFARLGEYVIEYHHLHVKVGTFLLDY